MSFISFVHWCLNIKFGLMPQCGISQVVGVFNMMLVNTHVTMCTSVHMEEEGFYGSWPYLLANWVFTNFFLLCLSLTVQSFCPRDSVLLPQRFRVGDFWHSLWEVWYLHLFWHFLLWPSCGGCEGLSSWQRCLPYNMVQHFAPPFNCPIPFSMGQSHGSQPTCSKHPQHQNAHDR